jgi:lipopolysaccharide transport system ATP-binding protein
MSRYAVRAERLSKQYAVGGPKQKYRTLREAMVGGMAAPIRRLQRLRGAVDVNQSFWALKEVSFDVECGEVVGIIGRNGAGKSTLLKILSRITMPSGGQVAVRGRVASLLEIGTGFHPELTGRENVFLNGAILGMTQGEVRKRFDEIVSFADVERFIDTPVKHYSSGMYMRLAFAIAAHLNTDILLVDEVLAVGDAEFQRKCLGMMDDVSRREGRTVVLVSHNMEAVLKLCNRGILLEHGQVQFDGNVNEAISHYLARQAISSNVIDLSQRRRHEGLLGNALFVQLATIVQGKTWSFTFGEELAFEIQIKARISMPNIEMVVGLHSARGFEVATWSNYCSQSQLPLQAGLNVFRIAYRDFTLLPGQYVLGMSLNSSTGLEDYVADALSFEVTPNLNSAQINAHSFRGTIVPNVKLSIMKNGDEVFPMDPSAKACRVRSG